MGLHGLCAPGVLFVNSLVESNLWLGRILLDNIVLALNSPLYTLDKTKNAYNMYSNEVSVQLSGSRPLGLFVTSLDQRLVARKLYYGIDSFVHLTSLTHGVLDA